VTRRPPALFDHELLVVTGKGGVGKTTVAAALGVAAARRGLRPIVAEVAARDDVTRALGSETERRDREIELQYGVHHTSIDPEQAMREYLVDQLGSRRVAAALTDSRTFAYLVAATPGLRELLTIGKVWELAQQDRRALGARPYDLVILDAPATGHGIAVLSAPHTFARTARVGRVARHAAIIDELVTDPRRTAVVAVARPEELPVNETLQLHGALRDELGLDISLAVVNRVLPDRLSAAEARTLAGMPVDDDAPVRIALAGHRRARSQRAQMTRLRRGLDCRVCGLHERPGAALDGGVLRALAGELERVL
jgi:anion-transporting  ArsA/GET3 family ATPase